MLLLGYVVVSPMRGLVSFSWDVPCRLSFPVSAVVRAFVAFVLCVRAGSVSPLRELGKLGSDVEPGTSEGRRPPESTDPGTSEG